MYQDLVRRTESAETNFETASVVLESMINNCSVRDFTEILKEIGTIPERLAHDSTAEKLYSKASDAVLARAFREIGLKAAVLRERGDSADVTAESPVYGYRLAADAKAFRMSRTAKNQKDFKVTALSGWRKNAEYAVLCAPYFQYPGTSSQIYAQALEYSVCLLSWEHLIFLIEHGIQEDSRTNLSEIWNFCAGYSEQIVFADRKKCFIPAFNRRLSELTSLNESEFSALLSRRIMEMELRGKQEIAYWKGEISRIEGYSREQAVRELIDSRKIHQKIAQIDNCIRRLQTNE